jgi:hypothetical protein
MRLLTGAGEHTAAESSHWVEHLRVDDLSCGTYSLRAGGSDDQEPLRAGRVRPELTTQRLSSRRSGAHQAASAVDALRGCTAMTFAVLPGLNP